MPGTPKLTFIFLLLATMACQKNDAEKILAAHANSENISAVVLTLKDCKNYSIPLAKIIDSLRIDPRFLAIKISKSNYELGVYTDTVLIKTYPVVFGGNPIDDKLRRGDRCTPEGRFKIRSKYNHAKWSRFIWIDYPNDDSWRKHRLAKEHGVIAKNADIGGEIGIHGTPDGYDEAIEYRQNWTLGCISMKNKDVIEVFPFITDNTWIEIHR